MKKRSGFAVMARLIGLVKPLSGYMSLAAPPLSPFSADTVCWQPFGLKYLLL